MPFQSPYLRSNKNANHSDPKPIHIRIDLPDGQYHEWDLGPGDAIGYGPLRVDARTPTLIRKRHRVNISFTEADAS